MNKEQQELVGDVYKNYEKWWKSYSPGGAPIPLSKEKFINKIKTDDEFAYKWGLKIEERELSLEERYDLIEKDKHTQSVKWESLGTDRIREVLDDNNIPTKLITITYNDKTIESYE
jgi:hypothetical protein